MIAFAKCSCGWRQEVDGMAEAASSLTAHLPECEHVLRPLMVPMWSMAWPWYWGDANQKFLKGEGPEPPFGLEMDWRPVGSQGTRNPLEGIGSDAKQWALFPDEVYV